MVRPHFANSHGPCSHSGGVDCLGREYGPQFRSPKHQSSNQVSTSVFISGCRADFLSFQLVDVHRGTNFLGDLAEMLVARQLDQFSSIPPILVADGQLI